MSTCGLDFGTSNTTLGTIMHDVPVLTALEGGHVTIPSAIFYEVDGAVLIGRKAIESYVEGAPGRLMRSLKSVLGTSLIDETTRTARERTSFRDIIAYYFAAVKRRAEFATGVELRNVVHGRPVHFVDNSPEQDRKAEATLRDIAHDIGFDEVTFQFEPIAAALDYERTIAQEEIALIADIGGGTSDFSIVRLSPERHLKAERAQDILANDGVRIGGTDFDRQLSLGTIMPLLGYRTAMKRAGLDVPSGYFHDLATWSNINRMYESKVMNEVRQVRYEAKQPELLDRLVRVLDEQRGHTLAMDIEGAKIGLSDAQKDEDRAGLDRARPARAGGAQGSGRPHPATRRPHHRADQDLPRPGGFGAGRHRRRVPDRRLGATRPCAKGHHLRSAEGPGYRRRHLWRRRQGPDHRGGQTLWGAGIAFSLSRACGRGWSRSGPVRAAPRSGPPSSVADFVRATFSRNSGRRKPKSLEYLIWTAILVS